MKFHETITENWNPLIMRVLANSVTHPDSILFGVTGDIDNLGLYVGKYGRAKAENLVDLVNQIIRNEMVGWVKENQEGLDDYTFVACGEESIILGLAKGRTIVDLLFQDLNLRLNKIIRDNRYIDIDETGISFGCAFLDDATLVTKIRQMIHIGMDMTGDDEFVPYLKIMECIRETLAMELDKIKFQTLTNHTMNSQVMYRNLVYSHMLSYKYNTARFLILLSEHLGSMQVQEQFKPLYQRYGLDDSTRRLAMQLKDMIEERSRGNCL